MLWPFGNQKKSDELPKSPSADIGHSVSADGLDDDLQAILRRAASHFPFESSEFTSYVVQPIRLLKSKFLGEGFNTVQGFDGVDGKAKYLATLGACSMQSAAGAVFSLNAPPRLRLHHQSLWQYAAFLGGIGVGMRNEFRDQFSHMAAVELIQVFAPFDLEQFFASDPDIFPTLTAAIDGKVYRGGTRFLDVLNGMHIRVAYNTHTEQVEPIELPDEIFGELAETVSATDLHLHDKQLIETNEATKPFDAPVSPNERLFSDKILPIMKSLAQTSQKWSFNQKGSRFWSALDGIFVIWPPALKDINGCLMAQGLEDSLMSFDIMSYLINAKIVAMGSPERPYTMIVPPSQSGKFHALKIISPSFIKELYGDLPEQIDVAIAAMDKKGEC